MSRRSASGHEHPKNSLGLSEQALESVFDQLDSTALGADPSGRRIAARWPFRHESVRVEFSYDRGDTVSLHLACRNLSRTGAGLLHRGYIHPGTACTVIIPHPERGEVRIAGTVARCAHRSGVVHELGVAFRSPIDLRSFIRPDPLQQWFETEQPEPASLNGTVLHVEPNAVDQKIIAHYLGNTPAELVAVENKADALARAQEGVDLILCAGEVGELSGVDVLRELRAENVRVPAILIGYPSIQIGAAVRGRLADAFLAKPVREDMLLRAVGEFFSKTAPEDGETVTASSAELLAALRSEIDSGVGALTGAIGSRDCAKAIAACVELSQIMSTVGMVQAAADLDSLIADLTDSNDINASSAELLRVAESCRRIK